jgi:hypothetical protein
MRMTAQNDVFGLVLSVLPSMEATPQILVLKNARLTLMAIMILVFACRPVSSMSYSTELPSILMLKTQLHFVCINVLLAVGPTISPTLVLATVVSAFMLILQPGNVSLCALQILYLMHMVPIELVYMPVLLAILHLKWDVYVY